MAPKEGFSVYYLLDGNAYFHFGHEVVRLQSKNILKTSVAPAIIVGIGHHRSVEKLPKRRFYEFTPSAESYSYPERLKGRDLGNHGGAEKKN